MAADPFHDPRQDGDVPPRPGSLRDVAAAGRGPRPARLDADDFDGLGDEAWLASLADQEPEPDGLVDPELLWPGPDEWTELEGLDRARRAARYADRRAR